MPQMVISKRAWIAPQHLRNHRRYKQVRDYTARSLGTLVFFFAQILKFHFANIYAHTFSSFKGFGKKMQGAGRKIINLIWILCIVFDLNKEIVKRNIYHSHKAILPLITKNYFATPNQLQDICN